jgi:hypothetical protein
MSKMITETQRDALNRLIEIAQGDTGQCRIVADFLLAWWNADECGGFNLTHVWAVDGAIADDMAHVFRIIRDTSSYPDQLGYKEDFQAILRQWRPACAV